PLSPLRSVVAWFSPKRNLPATTAAVATAAAAPGATTSARLAILRRHKCCDQYGSRTSGAGVLLGCLRGTSGISLLTSHCAMRMLRFITSALLTGSLHPGEVSDEW